LSTMAAEAKQEEAPQDKSVEFRRSENVPSDLMALTQRISAESIKDHGSFRIAVSGGSFSKHFANGITDAINIDFTKWKVFLADERCVALDSDDSNFKGFREKFMAKAKDIKAENVFPIKAELLAVAEAQKDDAKRAEAMQEATQQIADAYLKDIRSEFGIDDADKETVPIFDAIYLGMGGDGHTASLFPGHALLESANLVDGIMDSPKQPPYRITLTLPLICKARNIVFVVTGEAKQDAVKAIVEINAANAANEKQTEQSLPSGIVTQRASGSVVWILDEAASKTAKL